MRFWLLGLILCLLSFLAVRESNSQEFYAFGPYEYHVSATKYGSEPEKKCHSLNATLVTIKNPSVRNFLFDLIGNITGKNYTFGS